MTESPRLPVLRESIAVRHPPDGWVLADPVPLRPSSQRSLRGLIDALLPPAPAPRPAGMEERVQTHARRMIAYMPPALRLGFVLLTHVLDWSPLWRFKSFQRLQNMRPAAASAHLAEIATSRWLPLRLMMLAPKAIILSTYYDQDEVHALLDYEPKAFIRERVSHRESVLRARESAQASAHAGAAE